MKGNAMPGSRSELATYSEAFSAWDGKEKTMQTIDMSEDQDVREAAAIYREQTGSEYPHVAAEATILRG